MIDGWAAKPPRRARDAVPLLVTPCAPSAPHRRGWATRRERERAKMLARLVALQAELCRRAVEPVLDPA